MSLYSDISFPESPANRPYTYINMVATIDGKTVSGSRDETVMDLGSETDHETLRNLEAVADAVLVGGQTVRATPKMWFREGLRVVILTKSAYLLWHHDIFEKRDKLLVATENIHCVPSHFSTFNLLGQGLSGLLSHLKSEGVRRLVIEGGSEVNALFLTADLVDEIFLTVAPKIKLGAATPTIAGGEPLLKNALLDFELISCTPVGDEVFLRYKRRSK